MYNLFYSNYLLCNNERGLTDIYYCFSLIQELKSNVTLLKVKHQRFLSALRGVGPHDFSVKGLGV